MKNFHKYLTVGDFEKAWGFHINCVGFAKINPNQDYPDNNEHPQSHAFSWDRGRILSDYTLVFISKGEGFFESLQVPLKKINEGTCFFLYPGIWHRYKPNPNLGWEEYWVSFKGSYPDDLMLKDFFSFEEPIVEIGFNEYFLDLFHRLIETVKSADPGYQQVIPGITLEILGIVNAISKFKKENINDHTIRLISKAKFLLQEAIEYPIKIEDMAKDLPMGYSKFRKVFKQVTGLSPNQYYLEIRLNKAKALLISTDLSLVKISHLTGFETPFYFSTYFKKKYGMPPIVFRRSIKT
jgi:AraC-like DNA-binding protein